MVGWCLLNLKTKAEIVDDWLDVILELYSNYKVIPTEPLKGLIKTYLPGLERHEYIPIERALLGFKPNHLKVPTMSRIRGMQDDGDVIDIIWSLTVGVQ